MLGSVLTAVIWKVLWRTGKLGGLYFTDSDSSVFAYLILIFSVSIWNKT